MAEIAAFRGILYTAKAGPAERLLAPPYDVISADDRAKLAALDAHNCVRLILPDGEGDAKYARAATELRAWLADGTMARDAQPAIYRYHQTFTAEGRTATRKGFICRIRLKRFDEGVVLPHERTLAGPKADRLKLKRATRCHLSQVFGLYSDPARRTDVPFLAVEAAAPALSGTTTDGVEQKLWKLTDPAAIADVVRLLADKKVYIADGHHRYETMLALREELRRESGGRPSSSIEFGTIFLANMDDPSLLVFPTHRVVHGVANFDMGAILEKAREFFTVTAMPVGQPAEVRQALAKAGEAGPSFAIVKGHGLWLLSLRKDVDLERVPSLRGPAVVRRLDVTLLHALVIEGILGIDRAAQEAQTHLRYVKDAGAALREAADPAVNAVLMMNSTPVDHVRAVADAGEVMPQKSTFFYPKLASGLVLNPLDPRRGRLSDESLTRDAILRGRLHLWQPRRGYRFAIDPLLLLHFLQKRKLGRVADLGTGCGVIALGLALSDARSHVTGVELQPRLAELALRNALENQLLDRVTIIESDLSDRRAASRALPGASFDWAVSNPPYQPLKHGPSNPNDESAIARHQLRLTLDQLVPQLRRILIPKGRAALVYPAEHLTALLSTLERESLRPIRLRLVHDRADLPAERVLVEAHKGGKGRLRIEPPLILRNPDLTYTDEARTLLGEAP